MHKEEEKNRQQQQQQSGSASQQPPRVAGRRIIELEMNDGRLPRGVATEEQGGMKFSQRRLKNNKCVESLF